MKFRGFVFFFLLIINWLSGIPGSYAQIRFPSEWLQNPGVHAKEIESNCNYREIEVYELPEQGHFKQLFNSYAKAEISNPDSWKSGMNNIKVESIDIVFSKYPKLKEDWITNYYLLLANRLIELFKIDPGLNSPDIQFNLVVQTNCKTEEETKKLFHGIVIHFKIIEKPAIAGNKRKVEIPTTPRNDVLKEEQYYDYTPKPQRTYPKKKEKKRTVKKECPDFSKNRIK